MTSPSFIGAPRDKYVSAGIRTWVAASQTSTLAKNLYYCYSEQRNSACALLHMDFHLGCRLNSTCKFLYSSIFRHSQVRVLKRLDQGHLHLLSSPSRQTCPGRESNTGRLRRRRALQQGAVRSGYAIALWNFYISRPELLRRA